MQPFDGDLDDYQKWLLDSARAAAKGNAAPPVPQPVVAAPPAPAPAAAPRKGERREDRKDDRKQSAQSRQQVANRTRPLRAEVQQIDGRLEKLGAEKAALEAQLAAGTLAAGEIAETGRRLNHIAAEVAMLEERWLELQTEIEQITTAG